MLNGIVAKIKSIADVSVVDSLYKTLTFHDLLIATFPVCLKFRIARQAHLRKSTIRRMRESAKIVVAFFLQNPSVWKCDRLYRKFESSDRFEPIVVVCPFNVHINYDKGEMMRVLQTSEDFVKKAGYRYLMSYDVQKQSWRDVCKELDPDIVFYTKPYKDTLPQYHIYRFGDKLGCYVPYGINCLDIFRTTNNLPFHNLLWRFFVETPFHKEYAQQYSICKGENAQVVGSLGMETLMLPDYVPTDVWKPQAKRKKRIIWAPHHTVDYLFNFSNFFTYCDFMIELAEKYKEEIQIAFKPHPVLKFKLINIWGKEKTDEYYQRWSDLSNGQLEVGAYIDLFATSDALIHDCASFTAEYLYTQKPTMFIVKDEHTTDHLNTFGEKCFALHYHAHSPADVEQYIANVVIAGNDTMKTQREQFFTEYLFPKDGVMPSQKIVDTILNEIKKE